jgi:hypothetical protein
MEIPASFFEPAFSAGAHPIMHSGSAAINTFFLLVWECFSSAKRREKRDDRAVLLAHQKLLHLRIIHRKIPYFCS